MTGENDSCRSICIFFPHCLHFYVLFINHGIYYIVLMQFNIKIKQSEF